MASETTPKLATEILGMVIRCLDSNSDMVDLWTRCRLVSKTFKREVELFFREKHLPKTYISFDLGIVDSEHVPQYPLYTTFNFSRLSNGQHLAVFRYDFDGDLGFEERVKSDLRLYVNSMKDKEYIIAPKHSVETRAYLNDTPIPMLSLNHDDETLELSCDWQSMFSSLFYEESAVEDALAKFTRSFNPQRGGLDPTALMAKALQAYDDHLKESVKRTRRERIDRQLEKIGYPKEIGWDVKGHVGEGGERAQLEKLAEMRLMLSVDDYSDRSWETDDEEEEEEKEEEDDGDEEEEDFS